VYSQYDRPSSFLSQKHLTVIANKKIYCKFYIGTDANVVLHYDNKLLGHLKNVRQCSDARKDCTEAPELLRREEVLIL